MNRESTMAIKLTVKEGNNERSWDVMDGQQIDINMAKGAEYTLIDTQTGQTPDGMRVVNNHGQTEIYGSDTFPWVTLHDEGADEPRHRPHLQQKKTSRWPKPLPQKPAMPRATSLSTCKPMKSAHHRPMPTLKARLLAAPCCLPEAVPCCSADCPPH